MKVVGITSGCFDILHPLHLLYLNKCAIQCDELIVLVDSDRFVFENKGEYPIFNEDDRALIVEELKMVNDVKIIDSLDQFSYVVNEQMENKSNVVRIFKKAGEIYKTKTLEFKGTELVIIPDVVRFSSSTEIKNYIKSQIKQN